MSESSSPLMGGLISPKRLTEVDAEASQERGSCDDDFSVGQFHPDHSILRWHDRRVLVGGTGNGACSSSGGASWERSSQCVIGDDVSGA